MRKFSADSVFIENRLQTGKTIICDDDGKILSVTDNKTVGDDDTEKFEGILCPGFVNTHCHLELSYMRGKITEKRGLVQFIRDLLTIRKEKMEIVLAEIEKANQEMLINGIVAVGDISNDDHTLKEKSTSKIFYHTFVEAYGFVSAKAQEYFDNAINVFRKAKVMGLSASVTPHAPYSVPSELFRLIFQFKENDADIFSIHNQESEEETRFFKDGSGAFKDLLEGFFKIDSNVFHPTGKNSLESTLPFLPKDKRVLLVHNTVTNAEDIKMANNYSNNFFWCTCPNANLYIENRLPDYNLLLKERDKVCIGTDSLASNHQLSILEEIKTIQKHSPFVSTEMLLQWSTVNGAKFLGIESKLGSLEKNKTPGIIHINNIVNGKLTAASSVKRIV